MKDLPRLRRLQVSDVADLDPFAGCGLEDLNQDVGSLEERPVLSLSPLRNVPSLQGILIAGRRVANVATLRQLSDLTWLQLYNLRTSDALEELRMLRGLASLGVGGMPDLHDLGALSFLDHPTGVYIIGCLALTEIGVLQQWADTLQYVSLTVTGVEDIAALAHLRKLTIVTLYSTPLVDLAPIADLPLLTEVRLSNRSVPDLGPLRASPGLVDLYIGDVLEVDLEPLPGREGLTVRVDRPTVVHGADRLGPGSRVVRR